MDAAQACLLCFGEHWNARQIRLLFLPLMSDPFFITESYDPDQKLSAAQRKRQRMAKVAMEHHNSIIKKRIQKDSDSESMDDKPESQDEEEEVDETPAQKRLRLAKGYLELVKQEVHDIQDGEIDAAELDRELIAERLRSDVNEAAGRAFYQIADEFQVISQSDEYQRIYKGGKAGPQLPITCLAVGTLKGPMNQSSTYLYAGSKDAKIVKWDLMTGQRLHVFEGGLKPTKRLLKSVGQRQIAHDGHNDQVLCMDVSFDGTVLVSEKSFGLGRERI